MDKKHRSKMETTRGPHSKFIKEPFVEPVLRISGVRTPNTLDLPPVQIEVHMNQKGVQIQTISEMFVCCVCHERKRSSTSFGRIFGRTVSACRT